MQEPDTTSAFNGKEIDVYTYISELIAGEMENLHRVYAVHQIYDKAARESTGG